MPNASEENNIMFLIQICHGHRIFKVDRPRTNNTEKISHAA